MRELQREGLSPGVTDLQAKRQLHTSAHRRKVAAEQSSLQRHPYHSVWYSLGMQPQKYRLKSFTAEFEGRQEGVVGTYEQSAAPGFHALKLPALVEAPESQANTV